MSFGVIYGFILRQNCFLGQVMAYYMFLYYAKSNLEVYDRSIFKR